IIKLIRKRDKLHIDVKKGKQKCLSKFKSVKSCVQKLIRKFYWMFVESIISYNPDQSVAESSSTNKKFWSFIKNRRKDSVGVAPLKYLGQVFNEAADKANILNKQFQSVFSIPCPLSLRQICNFHLQSQNLKFHSISDFSITTEGILKMFQK